MKVVAFERSVQGTGASRRLRNSGKTPGIIYGGAAEPKMIELDHNALWHALKKEAFHSSILDPKWPASPRRPCCAPSRCTRSSPWCCTLTSSACRPPRRSTSRCPCTSSTVDPLGVKLGHGIVNHIVNELEVSCLPADLPEFIEVDLEQAELNQTLHLSDITLPKGVTAVIHGDDNPSIASVTLPAGAASEAAEGGEEAPQPEADRPDAEERAARRQRSRRLAKEPPLSGGFSRMLGACQPAWLPPERIPNGSTGNSMIKLIVGLGNPGRNTKPPATTPASGWSTSWPARPARPCAWKAASMAGGTGAPVGPEIWLLKPSTFMNRSGLSVVSLARFYKILPTRSRSRTMRWTCRRYRQAQARRRLRRPQRAEGHLGPPDHAGVLAAAHRRRPSAQPECRQRARGSGQLCAEAASARGTAGHRRIDRALLGSAGPAGPASRSAP